MNYLCMFLYLALNMTLLSAGLLTHFYNRRIKNRSLTFLMWGVLLLFVAGLVDMSSYYSWDVIKNNGEYWGRIIRALVDLIKYAGLALTISFLAKCKKGNYRLLQSCLFVLISALMFSFILRIFLPEINIAPPGLYLLWFLRASLIILLLLFFYRSTRAQGRDFVYSRMLKTFFVTIFLARIFVEVDILVMKIAPYDLFQHFLSILMFELVFAASVILFVKEFGSRWQKEASSLDSGQVSGEKLLEYGISSREKEVVELIVAGMSNKEIAEKLNISVSTVKDHVHRIFRKTDVNNRILLANMMRKGS